MTPERWQQVERLYHVAQEQPPAERAAFLDAACAGDADLRAEVDSLLAAAARGEAKIVYHSDWLPTRTPSARSDAMLTTTASTSPVAA